MKNFLTLWAVILIANQILFWRACMNPNCLIAAAPGTLIITTVIWFIYKHINNK